MIVKKLQELVFKAVESLKDENLLNETKESLISFEHPENPEHGDYSTNIALVLGQKLKKSPREIADLIYSKLSIAKAEVLNEIKVEGPGFINFFLSKKYLIEELQKVIEKKEKYGKSQELKNKKYLIEHTSPNTIKMLHVGHVRNNVLGMAVARLFEASGAKVKLDAINNDRGIHVMKANWAYLQYGRKDINPVLSKPKNSWKELLREWSKSKKEWSNPDKTKGDQFVDQFYMLGVKAEEKFEGAKKEMQEMLQAWEANDANVRSLWKQLRNWVFEGFLITYKRLQSRHDYQWFESEFYEKGRAVVEEGLKKGVFQKLQDGAVLTNLKDYDLSDAVVLRADGTTMYHTQDLYLTQLKRKKFPSNLYIWDIGPEQSLYLKQLFATCEQLGIGKRNDYFHLSYGYVSIKGQGRMSSRKGNVVSADWLIKEMVGQAKAIIEESSTKRGLSKKEQDAVAEAIGVGAIKYGFLKVARMTDIYFDMKESLSIEGNSAPYIQYTYARCKSILHQSKLTFGKFKLNKIETSSQEERILRLLYRFPEVTRNAANSFAPNIVSNFVFDVAKAYNNFYNMHRVLQAETKEIKQFRLLLTAATAQIIQNSLYLLGIKAPERM